jgi:fluoroacetyl-CoA thioesterase
MEREQRTASLAPGLSGEVVREVTDEITAHAMGSGGVRVFGTPAMIMLMEQAALTAVEPYLAEGQLAATPVGMRVTVRARLVEVDGRRLTFDVEAEDEREPVGQGRHERFVVDRARFLDRVQQKSGNQ